MNNALEEGNLPMEGQSNDRAGHQDKSTQQQEQSNDWESQAKYFQSEKDKLHVENQKLKQYEEVGKFLESRPDITQAVAQMAQGGQPMQPQRIAMEKDEFDPWEAYNDPKSKSYQFRQQELQDSINGAVQQQVSGIQKQMGMHKLQSELAARGLNAEEINSFVDFASKNPAEYGVDGAINMWKAVTNQEQQGSNPLDSVRRAQTIPQQAGILNGQRPVRESDDDSMWKGVLGADRVSNKLP
tara:strand:+ start:2448 stop:3170 length:723 start_codon:yes stop_codon:yes gene_type:complete